VKGGGRILAAGLSLREGDFRVVASGTDLREGLMPGFINMRQAIPDDEARDVFPLADLLLRLGDELEEARRRAKEDGREDLLVVKECSVELG
jgi:hypothetical protein